MVPYDAPFRSRRTGVVERSMYPHSINTRRASIPFEHARNDRFGAGLQLTKPRIGLPQDKCPM